MLGFVREGTLYKLRQGLCLYGSGDSRVVVNGRVVVGVLNTDEEIEVAEW